ncbi:hypothetical protein CR492_14240 [Methylocella silvestris]|uniref:Uncharacterized protein n=1 Tax=Methylocella silvestris TaxID=199596 RepID=A0A2J7TEW0_METSI|nr:hypothetical protein CR492_14240 [Methylocella silvestris]
MSGPDSIVAPSSSAEPDREPFCGERHPTPPCVSLCLPLPISIGPGGAQAFDTRRPTQEPRAEDANASLNGA